MQPQPGYLGFTYYPESALSFGIGWFSRWSRRNQSDLPVSHVFICTGNGGLIEAHIEKGVQRDVTFKYSSDPKCKLYFKRPKWWSPAAGQIIVDAAAKHLGEKYDTRLILSQMLANSFAGHFLNRLTRGWLDRRVSKVLNHRHQQICSELAATALKSLPELRHLGILNQAARRIKPQDLFDDELIWES